MVEFRDSIIQHMETNTSARVPTDTFTKKKRIILCGMSCAGKNYFRDEMSKLGWRYDVAVTTRPRRDHEVEGVDYHYISHEQFEEMMRDDKFFETVTFGQNRYGTLKESWDRSKVFIMTPGAVLTLNKTDRKESYVIFLDIGIDVRTMRMQKRFSTVSDINSRNEADKITFYGFYSCDYRETSPNFITTDILKKIEPFMDSSFVLKVSNTVTLTE